jgi:hypothetical protein
LLPVEQPNASFNNRDGLCHFLFANLIHRIGIGVNHGQNPRRDSAGINYGIDLHAVDQAYS